VLAFGFGGPVAEQALGESEVGAQRLGDVGAASRDLNDCGGDVAHAPAGTAVAGGNPQTERTGAAQPFDRPILKHSITLGFGVGATQLVNHLGEPGQSILR
jgi:hypothetical protein